jgi:hypothetical protein
MTEDSFEDYRTGYNQYSAALRGAGYTVDYTEVDGVTTAKITDAQG